MKEIRRLDDIGRITIPKEIRDEAFEGSFEEGFLVEVSCRPGEIILRPANEIRPQALSYSEISVFNAYIEDAKMDDAFGNSDWNAIYHKIVGNNVSNYAEAMMERYLSKER